jgi:hypothetical protein
MQIVVQARPHAERAGERGPASDELTRSAARLSIELRPIHPGTTDPDLARYFTAEVPDRTTVDRVIAQLLQSEAVEAAYIKPPDELP